MSTAAVSDPRALGEPGAAPAIAGPLLEDYHGVHNLTGLADLLERSLEHADAGVARHDPDAVRISLIDAFLAAAGMSQLLSDHLHRDPAELRKVAKYAARLGGGAGGALAGTLRGVARGLQLGRVGLLEREQVRRLAACEDLADRLSRVLWGPESGRAHPGPGSDARRSAVGLPSSRGSDSVVAIPPRSFSTFDQRPEDCARLAADFAARYPDRERPLLVVGVRTSGCFLAPIQAEALRRLGYGTVRFLSWRPGQTVLPRDRAALRWAAGGSALVLVTDDPPTSGGSFARVAEDMVGNGVAVENMVLLLQVFARMGGEAWRGRLAKWNQVVLDWERWHILRLLEPDAIQAALGALLAGREITVWQSGVARRIEVAEVTAVGRLALSAQRRDHVQGPVEISLCASNGERVEHTVQVKGVGLGFYGQRTSSIAVRLGPSIPEFYGIRDGLCYRGWIPGELAVAENDPDHGELAAGIAAYVASRARALPLARDLAAATSGHDALWEQCARWLSLPFGRAALPLRPLLHRAGRRLTAAKHRSLVDGDMGPGRWFWSTAGGDARHLLKVDWDERPFVYQIPFSYEAGYDLAAAAAERQGASDFGSQLRQAFAKAGGGRIDDTRWFLFRLLHCLDRRREIVAAAGAHPDSRRRLVDALTTGDRDLGALHRGYLAGQLLGDLTVPESGPLVAIDVDGVLETAWRSYSAPAPLSLLALRGLIVHGFRPVLVTGRSADEVVDRCRVFRLPAAVAEYGAGLVDGSGRFESLITDPQREDLERVRTFLRQMEGIELDGAYRHSVRAFTIAGGRRRGLPQATLDRLFAATGVGSRIRAIPGWAQTDFVAAGLDKGTGVSALAARLGVEGARPLRLAVGDSEPDLPMFELAETAACPASADPKVLAYPRIAVARHAYEAGLHAAVAGLIGHDPGGCRECRPSPSVTAEARLLMALLDADGRTGLAKLVSAAKAAAAL